MKYFSVLILCLLAGCTTTGNTGTDTPEVNSSEPPAIVLDREDVQQFRGVEMPKILRRMESSESSDWAYVRRHVHPAPTAPAVFDADGKLTKRNFDWPPRDRKNMSKAQAAWHSFLLWPERIRNLLLADDWSEPAVRARLGRLGRMYEVVHRFQNRKPETSPTRESEYWRTFAEDMLAFGDDGREMLVSNLILALTNPDELVVFQAQDLLTQVGAPAIEPLCTALWTGYNQLVLVELPDGRLDYRVETNANFPKHVVETLYRIGYRSVNQAIFELRNGPTGASAWRFRKHFIDLLGRFADARVLEELEAEIDRVKITEYDRQMLAEGKQVVDENATEHATFVYHEYLIEAIGALEDPEGIRAVIRLWKLDEFHETTAIHAIFRMSGETVKSLEQARNLAKALKVDLKGA